MGKRNNKKVSVLDEEIALFKSISGLGKALEGRKMLKSFIYKPLGAWSFEDTAFYEPLVPHFGGTLLFHMFTIFGLA